MTLFWHPTGPVMMYKPGTLHLADLNPEWEADWRMSRWAMLRLGFRCIYAALRS